MPKDKIRKIIGWISTALILAVAAALIISCVQINQSGSRPFTREVIGLYAGRIAAIGWICLAVVTIGLLIPNQADQMKAIRSEQDLLRRYSSDLPQAKKEQKLRRNCYIAAFVLIALLAVYPVIYFCDLSHFSIANLTDDIIRGLQVTLIPSAMALVLVFLCGRVEKRSISREIAAYQAAGVKPGKAPRRENMDPKRLLAVRCTVLTVAVVFIILGIVNGGITDVLGKAIRICTECIGLG